MKRVLRKQDRNDFNARIQRLDPAFAKLPAEAREERKPWEMGNRSNRKSDSPVMMTGFSFGLALVALYASNNPETVQSLLVRSGWPVQFIHYATNGIALLIIGLVLFYLANVLRILTPRATGRGNAAGLVVGAIAAIGVSNIDQTHIETGLQYAGFDSPADVLTFAQARTSDLANIDWTSVVAVSSSAK
ncbi:MAG: hypothetical protein MRY75_09965 [Marivita sp.]|uniref:hypothetical protein n=1 Tax=Marivita sp. TaxID=2003365 RepID=UPI0025BF1D33|nr:hypothetical protein [Marivita sp.]MCI5110864.1 hypothetical protein [Marivita sp.]